MNRIAVFGSSKCLRDSKKYIEVFEICNYLASKGYSIVSGGYGGVMEASLNGAYGYDVDRIGVTTEFYKSKLANKYVNLLIHTDDYHARLLKLVELGDNFIIFDGGTGTLLEFSYIWAMKSRGEIKEKKIVLFGSNWYNLLEFYSDLNNEVSCNFQHLIFADNIEIIKKIF